MVKKLTSFLTGQITLRLLFKAVLAGLFLFWVLASGFGWFPLIAFFGVVFIIYVLESATAKSIKASFWLLPIFTVVGSYFLLKLFPSVFPTAPIVAFVFAFIFFIILGLQNFLFKNRLLIYGILNALIFLILSLVVFSQNILIFWSAVLFLAVYFVFKESLGFFGVVSTKHSSFISAAVAFLGLVIGFFLSFLPLNFIGLAAFLTLFLLLVRDSFLVYSQGFLDLNFVFRELTFFILISFVIFAAGRWSIY